MFCSDWLGPVLSYGCSKILSTVCWGLTSIAWSCERLPVHITACAVFSHVRDVVLCISVVLFIPVWDVMLDSTFFLWVVSLDCGILWSS